MTELPYAKPLPRLSPKWRDRIIFLVVLAAGSALTLLAGSSLQQAESLRMKERLSAATQSLISTFSLELARTTEAVRAAGLMIESNPQLTREQYNRYMQEMVENQLSVSLMEWQPIVPANKLAEFEAATRTAMLPDFRVVQPDASGAGWEPVHGRDEYVPVLFAWPEKYRTEGLDMSFSPQRMASKLQSRTIGQPVASDVFDFMKEGMVSSGSAAVAISTTVFGVDRTAKGYLAAVVDLPTLFQSVTRLADAAQFDLLVFALATPEAAPIFAWRGDNSDLKQMTTGLRMATVAGQSATVDFAGQSWALVLHPRPAFYTGVHENGSRLAFVAGMGMTLLIAMVLLQLQISRRNTERAEFVASSARLALDALSQQLQEAQRIAHVGSWQMDVACHQVVMSDELCRMQGLIPGSSVPDFTEFSRLFTPESWERLSDTVARTLESGAPYELKLEMVKPDGSHGWMLARGEAVRGASGSIVALRGTATDITERQQAEAELIQHRDHLEELVLARTTELAQSRDAADAANRAKSIFLATMSHEMRTPLNGVMGMIDLVLRRATDLQQIDWLNKSKVSAKHLLDVISDILDISQIEAQKLTLEEKNFSLTQVFEEILLMLGAAAQAKGLRIYTEISPALPRLLCGDPTRLRQILINFVSNAIKFSDHGLITVSARTVAEDKLSVLLRIEVTDQGIGIHPEQQARLFHAFTQADGTMTRKYGGTGLGLNIAKRIAILMGGDAGVISEEGQGSTFWVNVRLKTGSDVGETPQQEHVDAEAIIKQRYFGHRILVADDEPINREVARVQLETVDIVVDTAEDGAEAVAMVRENTYVAIFMDLQMPKLNGVDTTREIRQLPGYRNIPIIAMTANAFAEDKAQCFAAGINPGLTPNKKQSYKSID